MVWETLREWTQNQVKQGRPICELILPPKDTFRTVIGYSYYLAFPHQSDRRILAEVLAQANLTEIDPPVRLTLETLDKNRKNFSKFFNEDLDHFINDFLRDHRHLGESAFWRAIRQEAIRPSLKEFRTNLTAQGRITILAQWRDDETLCPFLACTQEYAAPKGHVKQALQDPIGQFTHEVMVRDTGDTVSTIHYALENPQILPSALRLSITQGVLPLDEITIDEFEIATGSGITGCSLALVREDQVQSFVTLYGGSSRSSAIRGWFEVEKCRISQLDTLSPLMPDATILLHTSDSRTPRMVGGVQASSGAFYRLPTYLPVVRAPSARCVDVVLKNRRISCVPTEPNAINIVDWNLPQDLVTTPPIELLIEAEWIYELNAMNIVHRGTCQCKIIEWHLGLDYRNVPSGHYWLESCARGLDRLEGPAQDVSIGVTTRNPRSISDLIRLEQTIRWLGTGVGEMSCIEDSGFQWLTVGPRNRPDFLIFVGDKDTPKLPERRWSASKADRRHWRQAFSDMVPAYVLKDGKFVDISKVRAVQAVHKQYRRTARIRPHPNKNFFQSARLPDVSPQSAYGVEEVNPNAEALGEVLSVLASNRSRISLREFHDHLGRLTNTESRHSLRQQIARAWTECGLIDLLQRQDGRQTIVVARRPRFVVFRRGPEYSATLMGLLPRSLNRELTRVMDRLQLRLSWKRSVHKFQPFVASVSTESIESIERASHDLAFPHPEFLDWPDLMTLPMGLSVEGEIIRAEPPQIYENVTRWCVVRNSFTHAPEDTGSVVVERRTDGRRAPIYVLSGSDGLFGWSYSRTWALLVAAERGNPPPFRVDRRGVILSTGHSPPHLPLPLARLCAVVGIGLPGPDFESTDGRQSVRTYAYPFGSESARVVKSSVPRRWISEED